MDATLDHQLDYQPVTLKGGPLDGLSLRLPEDQTGLALRVGDAEAIYRRVSPTRFAHRFSTETKHG